MISKKDFIILLMECISNVTGVEKEFNPEYTFKNTFGLDSLDFVDMLITFEKKLNITFPDELIFDEPNVDKLGAFVELTYNYYETKKR